MRMLLLMLLIILCGCSSNHGSTDCCQDHGGVAMCYRATGATHGHIMCRDGYTCREECE